MSGLPAQVKPMPQVRFCLIEMNDVGPSGATFRYYPTFSCDSGATLTGSWMFLFVLFGPGRQCCYLHTLTTPNALFEY